MTKENPPFWKKMKKKSNSLRMPLSTARVWLFMLLGCVVLGIALVVWSSYLFFAISAEDLFTPTNGEEGVVLTIDRGELADALEFIALRESRFGVLQTTPPDIVAPER